MNQKRAPETITSAMPYARYACLIGATGMAEVRAVSGLPPRVPGVTLGTLSRRYFFRNSYGGDGGWEQRDDDAHRGTPRCEAERACPASGGRTGVSSC